MIHTDVSRRGFLTRLGAGAAAVAGSSVVGGWSTRAWAGSLRKHSLPAAGLPVVDKPQSVVPVGAAESLRREQWAYQLSEVQTLIRDLTSKGFDRVGDPVGVDGVAGYASEGGHSVTLGFEKEGGDKAFIPLVARWWDETRDRSPVEVMPDVYYTEVIVELSMVRFHYVDDQGGVAIREEFVNPVLACEQIDCHTNPPGHCHEECDTCVHCLVPTNVCQGRDEGCEDFCLWCYQCSLLYGAPGAAAMCGLTCFAVCGAGCEYTYCCDYVSKACCWNPTGGLPVPYCV